MLGLGHLKSTKRYLDAHKGIRDAKQKYNVDNALVTGYSLGGAITRGIASNRDKVINYNSGATIGTKARPNVKEYRTRGDLVSSFVPKANTLKNPNIITGIRPVDALLAHKTKNLLF
jgi:hypothetical protein